MQLVGLSLHLKMTILGADATYQNAFADVNSKIFLEKKLALELEVSHDKKTKNSSNAF